MISLPKCIAALYNVPTQNNYFKTNSRTVHVNHAIYYVVYRRHYQRIGFLMNIIRKIREY